MKKYLFVLMLCLMPFAVQAIDCPKGRVVKNAGGDLCASKKSMNYYTAFSWCDSQGMRLQTMSEICGPEWDGDTGTANCPWLVDAGNTEDFWGWSATPVGASHALYVNVKSANVNDTNRNNNYYALCR